MHTATPNLYFVHVDHLQRPIMMTDASKVNVWAATWLPFGAAYNITGTAANDTRFPGQWFQVETGLNYNWNRHYDPTRGRYTQADPLGLIDGPSIYAYAGSNPQNRIDPDGRAVILLAGAPAAAAAAGVAVATAAAFLAVFLNSDKSDDAEDEARKLMPPNVCPIPGNLDLDTGNILQNKKSKQTGKERATDTPSWVKGQQLAPGESGREFADRVMDAKYGKGNYSKGAGREHNKIRKYGDAQNRNR